VKKQRIKDNHSIIKNPNFRGNNDTELNKADGELTFVTFRHVRIFFANLRKK